MVAMTMMPTTSPTPVIISMEDSNVYANLPAVLGGARPALGTAFVTLRCCH